MNASRAIFSREVFRRFLLTLRVPPQSPVGGKARWLPSAENYDADIPGFF
jgi:hypothetical protein